MAEKRALAADFGASGGRVVLGRFTGERLAAGELHRFSNDPVALNGTLYWDFLRLFRELGQGLLKALPLGGAATLGVDAWGVDFGLLDAGGSLLANPVHYRDGRTAGMPERAFRLVPPGRFYAITGTQTMEINTAFQLLALAGGPLLERADTLLLMPDLFNYFLSGVKAAEVSAASTTQLLDAAAQDWSDELVSALGLPRRLLPGVVPSGVRLGPLAGCVRDGLGLPPMEVVAVAGHDTQSALAAVPAGPGPFVFISCGTWSLFGAELPFPLLGSLPAALALTNERGVGGRVSFLKNIIGLWLVQECRRQWGREGREYGFGELEARAAAAPAFRSLIDPDAPEFLPAGDLPARIRAFCRGTGQPQPEDEGAVVRCVNESLALKYRAALEELCRCTGQRYPVIHLVGGGAQSALLCQMTADACGLPVLAGPVEATALGNLAVQLMAAGELAGLDDVRRLVRDSTRPVPYAPGRAAGWEDAYGRFRAGVLGKTAQQ